MRRMGRPRVRNKDLPAGVRLVGGRYYWRPASQVERDRRRAQGMSESVPLGADPTAMRKAWARLMGVDRPEAAARSVAELLDRYELDELEARKSNGVPKRRPKTIHEYRRSLRVLREHFGARRYARTETEAAAGECVTTLDVQLFLRAATAKVAANRHVAVLSDVFAFARRAGLALYNPCVGVEKNAEDPRTRDVRPWEVEVLVTAARRTFAHAIEFADLTGMSAGDTRALQRAQLTPHGIEHQRRKTGARVRIAWSPALRACVDTALAIGPEVRGTVFCNRRGKMYTAGGWETTWQRTLARANALIRAAGALAIDSDAPPRLAPIVDLVFHDIRKKAGNDVADRGEDGSKLLANRPETFAAVYRIRGERAKPSR